MTRLPSELAAGTARRVGPARTTGRTEGCDSLVAAENAHRAGAVVEAPRAAAGAVRDPDVGVTRDLYVAGAALELERGLDDLRHTGRADRVTPGEQAPARVDRNVAVDGGHAVAEQFGALTAGGEAEGLVVHDLRDREGVVHFGDPDLGGRDAGLVVGSLDGPDRQLGPVSY